MRNDLHSLFKHREKPSFHDNIKISDTSREKLNDASQELISVIKQGFKSYSSLLEKSLPFKVPTPFFAIQGSYSYRTLIDPAHSSQQIDLDLGLYLPFNALETVLEDGDVIDTYFFVVETCIEEYIASKNHSWTLLKGDSQKDTCVRVELDEYSHIDIPLYGYPEKYASEIGNSARLSESIQLQSSLRAEDTYTFDRLIESKIGKLQPNEVHLADRKRGWVASNAIVLGRYIKERLKNLGSESRSIVRYIKAWRDYQWPDGGGPSSLYLLMLTIESIDNVTTRHCELVSLVADKTESVLNTPLLIPCPKEEDPDYYEDLNDKIDREAKEEYRQAFELFRNLYSDVKMASEETVANERLISIFGDRMPLDPSRIKELNYRARAAQKAVISAEVTKRSIKAPRITTGG